jgi:asparagine synthase (glutamine-hydrolysing)
MAVAALEDTASLFPSLDGEQGTTWQSDCGSVIYANKCPSPGLREPRQYVAETEQAIFAYDGLPIDEDDRIAAHRAEELGNSWNDSETRLDGFFCALKIRKKPLELELQFDNFGVYPMFYWTDGRSWLVSNSVALLDQVTGERSLDPEGVSRFLTMGWVAGDRTLRQSVRAFPAGERWTWRSDNESPARTSIVQRGDFANQKKRKLARSEVASLGEAMARPMASLGRNFENVLCPLTGGRDSRILAALLAAKNVSARYYTYGNTEGRDSEIAGEIAGALNIDHETLLTKSIDLLANWDEMVKGFVMRGDGLCPIHLITGAVTASDIATGPIPVRIWGAGGELARAMYFNPMHEVRGATLGNIQDHNARRWISNANGLVRTEVCAMARSFIDDTIAGYADDGFPVEDLNDVFFLYERGARRAGKNMRATMSSRDSYSPFFARSFVDAVFSSSIRLRRTADLHYRLLEEYAPATVAIPFDKNAWSIRSPSLNVYMELTRQLSGRLRSVLASRLPALQAENRQMIVKDTMFQRVAWLKQIRSKLREMCLDSRNSPVWDFLDREAFATVTSDSAGELQLARNAKILFLAATLYYYDSYSSAVSVAGSGGDGG